ncbi:neuronal acetylcholine receptor subunit alpha-9-like [Saccoglossus kowalevskii]|uniref:Neuronal acetylcholine receptor subunit alpha-9-like n=1 Tax=Saccoglossus kowalevskii TaxID=10224 RepID=A0ABM0GWF8_SACKO|nr:PREDICTED: neuronal acetylcholine receptor subunit alpha-9-like [Saccoglossus kowalevskii]
MSNWLLYVASALLLLVSSTAVESGGAGGDTHALLINTLLSNYSKYTRPVINATTTTVVSHRILPIQILDVDEKNQIITLKVWLALRWYDEFLTWNPSDFGGINVVNIPVDLIWQPDIYLYGSTSKDFVRHLDTDVQIYPDGLIIAPQPVIYKSTCEIDATFFPFDQQECYLKFGSWTYDGFRIDLDIYPNSGKLDNYIANGEWHLFEIPIVKHVAFYICCIEPYPDITYTLIFQRRSLFYFYTLVIPAILLFVLVLVGFYLPSNCGERMTLFVTSMLALIVFLTLVSEYMPPTSNSTPYLQRYLLSMIGFVSAASVLTGININIHFQAPGCPPIPRWLQNVAFNYLAVIACMRGRVKTYLKHQIEAMSENEYSGNKEIEASHGTIDDAEHVRQKSLILQADNISYNYRVQGWQLLAQILDRILLICFLLAFVSISVGMFTFLYTQKKGPSHAH